MPLSTAMTGVLLGGLVGPLLADEALPALRVNGVRLEVTQLAGADLPAQVTALESRWLRGGGAVLPWQERGGWRLLSHRDGRWHEVLQVRSGVPATEAWLSRLDTQQSPAPVPVLPLPPGCRARSTVESLAMREKAVQVVGQCTAYVPFGAPSWAAGLVAKGWQGGGQSDPRVFRFRRGPDELTVVFGLAGASGSTGGFGFTALQVHAARESP